MAPKTIGDVLISLLECTYKQEERTPPKRVICVLQCERMIIDIPMDHRGKDSSVYFPSETPVFGFEVTKAESIATIALYPSTKKKKANLLGEVTATIFPDLDDGETLDDWYEVVIKKDVQASGSVHMKMKFRFSSPEQQQVMLSLSRDFSQIKRLLTISTFTIFKSLVALDDNLDRLSTSLIRIFLSLGNIEDVLSFIIAREVKRTTVSTGLFRENNVTSKMLSYCMRFVGDEYLKTNIGPIVIAIFNDPTHFEVDPNRLPEGEVLEQNVENLKKTIKKILNTLIRSVNSMMIPLPATFLFIARTVHSEVEVKFPGDGPSALAGTFFLRYYCAALLKPQQYGLCLDSLTSDVRVMRYLILVVKIIQNIASDVEFGVKERYLECMSDIFAKYSKEIRSFFDELISKKKQIGSLAETKVRIRKSILLEDYEYVQSILAMNFQKIEDIELSEEDAARALADSHVRKQNVALSRFTSQWHMPEVSQTKSITNKQFKKGEKQMRSNNSLKVKEANIGEKEGSSTNLVYIKALGRRVNVDPSMNVELRSDDSRATIEIHAKTMRRLDMERAKKLFEEEQKKEDEAERIKADVVAGAASSLTSQEETKREAVQKPQPEEPEGPKEPKEQKEQIPQHQKPEKPKPKEEPPKEPEIEKESVPKVSKPREPVSVQRKRPAVKKKEQVTRTPLLKEREPMKTRAATPKSSVRKKTVHRKKPAPERRTPRQEKPAVQPVQADKQENQHLRRQTSNVYRRGGLSGTPRGGIGRRMHIKEEIGSPSSPISGVMACTKCKCEKYQEHLFVVGKCKECGHRKEFHTA